MRLACDDSCSSDNAEGLLCLADYIWVEVSDSVSIELAECAPDDDAG